MQITIEASDFYPPSASDDDALTEILQQRFGGTDGFIVSVHGRTPLDMQAARPLLEMIASNLNALPEIRNVIYRVREPVRRYREERFPRLLLFHLSEDDLHRYAARLAKSGMQANLHRAEHSEHVGFKTWIPKLDERERRDPLGFYRLARRYLSQWRGGFRIHIRDGYFSSRDRRYLFLVAEPTQPARRVQEAIHLVNRVEQILAEIRDTQEFKRHSTEFSISVASRAHIFASGYRTLLDDARRALIGSSILVLITLSLFFRRLLASLVIFSPIVYGLLVTAGLASLIYSEVNLLALLFAAALIGIGVDFSIHIGTHYWLHSGHAGEPIQKRLSHALERPGRGIVFGALTTASAFFALSFSNYKGLGQIGILTSLGIVLVLLSALTVFPMGLRVVSHAHSKPRILHYWTTWFDGLSQRRPSLGIALWVTAVCLSSLGIARIQYEPHPWNIAVRGNSEAETLERLTGVLGTSLAPLLIVSEGDTQDEAIARDREVTAILDRIRTKAGIAMSDSIGRLLPDENQQLKNLQFIRKHADLFSKTRFETEFNELLQNYPQTRERIPRDYAEKISQSFEIKNGCETITLKSLKAWGLESEIERHVAQINERYLIVTYVYLTRFPWDRGAVTDFLKHFNEAGGSSLQGTKVMGEAMRSIRHPQYLKREALQASLIALGFVVLLLSLEFRKIGWIALTLLPLLTSIWITLGVMGFLGIELSFLTLSITPILLGIGIDDGLHVMERVKRGYNLSVILRETGSSMTVTTVTTAAAFLSLSLAQQEAVKDFAFVATTGILLCLFSSIHLLPCLLRRIGAGKQAPNNAGG